MNERSLGVTLVAILTLLSSFALFLLFGFYMLLAVVGGPHTVDWLYWILINPPIPVSVFLSAYAFFLSISMFSQTKRYVWYASVLFWLMTIAFFSWWGYSFVWRYLEEWFSDSRAVYAYQYEIIIVTLLPLAYSIGCLIYFQTARVKDCFKIKTVNTSSSADDIERSVHRITSM